ncbi:MAG: metallophosphoesterase [bacterium]
MGKKFFIVCIIFLLLIVSGCSVKNSATDPIKFRFAILGDIQVAEIESGYPSCTNVPQLRQTIIDINNSNPRSQFIFINGDIVTNLVNDNGEALRAQLSAWQDVYNGLPVLNKIQLLPIAGNHESNFKDLRLDAEAPNPGAINEWLNWFAQNGYNFVSGNGPTPTRPNPDSIVRDESNLTYSFNIRNIHFVVINTDTLNTNTDPTTGMVLAGWIPINWIENDVRNAQLNPAISTIILVGHKPIEAPSYSAESDNTMLNTSQHPLADRLSSLMSANNKVKLYLACHCHSWDAIKLNNGNGIWEVIVGNGGAHIEESWAPQGGAYFGYSIIDIYRSGKIVLSDFGRALPPPPQKFYEDSPVPPEPATLRQELVIY